MSEALDRIGPANKAPAKPMSESDLELEELLKKSFKSGK
jgi:hypothetical protein